MPNGDDKTGPRDQDLHHRLARLAGRQLGVVSLEQLYELGCTYERMRTMVRQGRLHRVHHNVYAVGHRRLVDNAYLLAALLSVGPGSFLSRRTAAAAWGLRAVNLHGIELTLPGTGGRRRRDVALHRTQTEPHPNDIRARGELRVSSVPRLLVELASREKPQELERLITLSVQKRLLRLDTVSGRADLETALGRHERWPGLASLGTILAGYRRTESHKSQLELAFDRFLGQHPELPSPKRNVHVDCWEIDRFWPAARLVVELDGRPYHLAARDMERDRIKDAALQRLGCIPLRFTDFRFEHDRAGILGDLRHFLLT